ncbi:UNVERIFIED_CONTAM: hypothetical protein GTU68_024467, partial [Idotea baltica]|nr:hypothetical protein [Idotea baltica]
MFNVISFYKFKKLDEAGLKNLVEKLKSIAEADNWLGLIILANEGANGTIANANKEALLKLKNFLCEFFEDQNIDFKESTAKQVPFKRFKIKVRPEIVTIGRPDLFPDGDFGHLSPKEWHAALNEKDENTVLIDTRNWYETEVGIFQGAIDPKMEMFTEFEGYVKKAEIPKDKKIMMYCTGGIRCEKASLLMKDMGYDNVFQLKGGILKYMEEFPEGKFDGECFVFDHRVAVNKDLNQSEVFALCPLCGNPGTEKITCIKCD